MSSETTTIRDNKLLDIRDLKLAFFTRRGIAKVLDDVCISIRKGEILGLVGETGSGKTVTGLSIIDMIPYPGRILGGEIWFRGEEWRSKNDRDRIKIRGEGVTMIFQNAKSSLNPLLKVEEQIGRALQLHRSIPRKEVIRVTEDMLRTLGLPDPNRVMHSYPHELSGGMAQRIVIATAIARQPDLLIADEPTTALDVTTQAEILMLLKELRDELGTSVLLITHDLGVIAETCERVAVMHAGQIVEIGATEEVFHNPLHPYTEGLIHSIPRADRHVELMIIGGKMPDLIQPPRGCRFIHRCNHAMPICSQRPPTYKLGHGHEVMCFLFEGDDEEHT